LARLVIPLTDNKSISLPYQPNNPQYYIEIEDTWNRISQAHLKKAKGVVSATITYQPFSHAIGKASAERGGNAMGLTANDKDRFILEIASLYTHGADDQLVQDIGKEITDTLTKQLVSLKVSSTAFHFCRPKFKG
jgi:hypothetical protein